MSKENEALECCQEFSCSGSIRGINLTFGFSKEQKKRVCDKWKEAINRGLANSAWSAFCFVLETARDMELPIGILTGEDFINMACSTLDLLMNAEDCDGKEEN